MSISLIGSVVAVVTGVMTTVGIPGLLALMVASSFGFPPIPCEITLPFAGFLIANGTFSFGWVWTAALAGILIGAFAAYSVGRWWRDRITRIGIGHLRLEPRHLERVDRFFARRGEITVALFRNVPVALTYISYPAGTARMNPVRFGVYTLIGSLPYTLALIYAGIVLRSDWNVVSSYFSYLDIPLFAVIVLVVVYLVLQIVGVLEPGWPPRRVRAKGSVGTAETASPGNPPPSA
ncbi:MAG: DedA family protein [Thermoplasmata archaeon]|jgi:membrane protein DedA with SNARE-associated domain